MRISTEDGMTWYEGSERRAVVSRNRSGYMVHSFWDRDGKCWCGGYGEGSRPCTLDEATDLAKRFVSGQTVPEELGGYEDNKPLCGGKVEAT